MNKFSLISLIAFFQSIASFAQTSGSISVGGDIDKFYPVTWADGGWYNHAETQLEIGRSDVHTNSDWRGSTIAKFSFHTHRYGNSSRFINAIINTGVTSFIAGWRDATYANGSFNIIIWLRGGGTTYYFKSNYNASSTVYDGVLNALPFQEVNGPAHSYKTTLDPYVNSAGISYEGTAYFTGSGLNYFAGNMGLGIINPTEKLEVNGKIRAKEIKVETANWPDYVFESKHKLLPLLEVEAFIKENKHLPEIPSAAEVEKDGVNLGEMNAKLLKKIEELTLHLIDQNKFILEQAKSLAEQNHRIKKLENK